MLDAPLWKPPSPRWRGRPGRTPRRLRGWSFGAVGEGRERVRARHGRRTSTASGCGASPPLPPKFPVGERLPVMRACWGLRPLPPKFPVGGTFAGHARLLGAYAPLPQGSPLGDVCRLCAPVGGCAPWPPAFPKGEARRSCALAHGTAFVLAFAGNAPRKSPGSSCRAAARSSVTPLARLWPQATLARPQRGNPKGGAALFGQSLPTFCWPESRGPARPERVEGRKIKFNRRKEDQKSPAPASKGKEKIIRKRKRDQKRA